MPNPIRPIQQEDYDQIEEIWLQESVRVHNWMDDPEAFWNKRRNIFRKDTHQRADAKSVFVEDSIIKGFVTSQRDHILELFVDRPYQGKGIGCALLDPLKTDNERESLAVNVYMLNHKAIRFYIKNDFIVTNLYAEERTGLAKFWMTWKKQH